MSAPVNTKRSAIEVIRSILRDPRAFRYGVPQFKSMQEMHNYLTERGFVLVTNVQWGDKQNADARHLVYQGPFNSLAKVKTAGDAGGRRSGKPYMSFEITNGKGTEFKDAIAKVNGSGNRVAKNHVLENEIGGWSTEANPVALVRQRDGTVREMTIFEVVQGGRDAPVNKDVWADKTHWSMPEKFDSTGAGKLRVRTNTLISPKLRAVGKYVGVTIGTAAIFILLEYFRARSEQQRIEQEIEAMKPRIDADIQKQHDRVMELHAQGKKVHARVRIHLFSIRTNENEFGVRMQTETAPVVEYDGLTIEEGDPPKEPSDYTERDRRLLVETIVRRITWGVPLELTSE